jgi:translation initiation factor IF-2
VTVAEMAEKMKRKVGEVIKTLVELGVMATINALLDPAVVRKVADRFGFDVEFRSQGVELPEEEVDPSRLTLRPPVVTVMGHVDHGKTSLLDAIRRTKVAEKEHGGITQHIGAYQVETSHGKVTFLDTPGHEAFTAMRARGAQATDIVILVVAADDGVMPQTVEAINHAKAANVPILVAVNKIDKPGADPERVKRELANLDLVPEEWGGQTIFVETSAKRGTGIENLLEMTALQSEIMELKADPTRAARGVVIEARLERGRGPVATVLIQQGTLQESDAVVAGLHFGRVRAMFDAERRRVKEAGPSMPVEILGLSGVPQAGDTFAATAEERRARQIALVRQAEARRKIQATTRVTLEDLHKQIKTGEVKELRLILKADVQGSAEALVESLERLSTDEVKLKVIHGSVGNITETDVMLASASNAIILGFNVRSEPKATAQAQAEGVDIRNYTVIYEALNDLKAALEGMLAPEIREVKLGRAQIKALFPISKVGTVTGCQVIEGKVTRNARVRLLRDGQGLAEGTISSLKRFKDDAREVLQGFECGIGLEGITDVRVGDVLEFFTTEDS